MRTITFFILALSIAGCGRSQAERLEMRMRAAATLDREVRQNSNLQWTADKAVADKQEASLQRERYAAHDDHFREQLGTSDVEHQRLQADRAAHGREGDVRRDANLEDLRAKLEASNERCKNAKAEFDALLAD